MDLTKKFDTLVETMNYYRQNGYDLDFNMATTCLTCSNNDVSLSPKEFEVDAYYRFEGMSNPEDSSILYLIRSLDGELKGQLVNGYGIYSDTLTDEMMEKLSVRY